MISQISVTGLFRLAKCARKYFGIAAIITVIIFGSWACSANNDANSVRQAYDLRMSGKVDEAMEMLEKIISSEPENAAAHYELARTRFHIGLGRGQEILSLIDSVQSSIDRAMELDPDNIIYTYFAGQVAFLKAYMALQGDKESAKESVEKVCKIYEDAVSLKPDYKEPLLYLVEIYGDLPEDVGGDKAKAEVNAEKLRALDELFATKAGLFLKPRETDRIAYWQQVREEHGDLPLVLEELGKEYLYNGNTEEGIGFIRQAYQLDPSKKILLLDIARYYLMTMMRDENARQTAPPMIEEVINQYLETDPSPQMKAYALELLAKLNFGLGNNAESERLRKEAEALDPYFSKAFGIPPALLYTPPGEITYGHRYSFRPF